MPPLHPAFVHFPIALMAFSFITDLLGRLFNKRSLTSAGFWCVIGAILIGAITILTGLWEKVRESPKEFLEQRTVDEEGLDAATRDFIAGMTDRYAVSLFEQLFIPKPWTVD